MYAKRLVGEINAKVVGLRSRLFAKLPHERLFPSDVLLHFSYHKCITSYFNRVMGDLALEFGFAQRHFNNNVFEFENAVLNSTEKSILSINNRSNLNFSKYPSYKGSHFIRDPRDLVVSGYRYHLWTKEPWCSSTSFNWSYITI